MPQPGDKIGLDEAPGVADLGARHHSTPNVIADGVGVEVEEHGRLPQREHSGLIGPLAVSVAGLHRQQGRPIERRAKMPKRRFDARSPTFLPVRSMDRPAAERFIPRSGNRLACVSAVSEAVTDRPASVFS